MEQESKLYLYKKEYILLTTGNIFLKNEQPLAKYREERIKELEKNYYTEEEVHTKLKILNEFFEMYNFDCLNANVPEPFGIFDSEEEKEVLKKKKLLLQEIVLCLGNIYKDFHKNIGKKQLPIPAYNIPVFVVDYNELYKRAINEYFSTLLEIKTFEIIKNKNSLEDRLETPRKTLHAYGTSYILPSLIEIFLALKLQSKMIHICLDELKNLIHQGKVNLTLKEKQITEAFDLKGETGKQFFKRKTQILTELYEIFVKYKLIEINKYNEMILVQATDSGKKPITLGTIINENNKFAKQVLRPEYLKLITYLFDPQKLNIRNHIMHCNNVSFDYFNIALTSIMLQLFWDVMKNDVFKE